MPLEAVFTLSERGRLHSRIARARAARRASDAVLELRWPLIEKSGQHRAEIPGRSKHDYT